MPRWTLSSAVIALTATVPLIASADAPADLDGDVHVDLEAYANQNPPELPLVDDMRPQGLGSKMVFVNYDGANMNGGCGNNPQNNCSTIYTGVVEPFVGDAALRASIIQWVRERIDAYGMSITDTRPTSGDYDMEMVGAWASGSQPGVAGVAPSIDCWDNSGGQTSFTMLAGGAESVGEVIVQEIAHTWGLAHVDDKTDLLYPTTEGQGKMMQDVCSQIVSNTDLNPSSSGCSHHQQACGSNSKQNSHQELLLIFGPGTPDTIAPTVTILQPNEGETFPTGHPVVDVVIELDDNQTPMTFDTTLTLTGNALNEPQESHAVFAGPAQLKFPLSNLPDGSYTVTFQVFDDYDNQAQDAAVSFVVGDGAGSGSGGSTDSDSSSGGGTTTDDSSSGGGSTTDDSSSGGGSTTDDSGNDSAGSAGSSAGTGLPTGGDMTGGGGDDGCACTTQSGGHGAWMLLPFLAGVRRRRRA